MLADVTQLSLKLNIFKLKLREKRVRFYLKTADKEIPILKLDQECKQ